MFFLQFLAFSADPEVIKEVLPYLFDIPACKSKFQLKQVEQTLSDSWRTCPCCCWRENPKIPPHQCLWIDNAQELYNVLQQICCEQNQGETWNQIDSTEANLGHTCITWISLFFFPQEFASNPTPTSGNSCSSDAKMTLLYPDADQFPSNHISILQHIQKSKQQDPVSQNNALFLRAAATPCALHLFKMWKRPPMRLEKLPEDSSYQLSGQVDVHSPAVSSCLGTSSCPFQPFRPEGMGQQK